MHVYVTKHEEKIDKFYSTQDNAKSKCKSQEIIITGDLNSKIRKERGSEIVSIYELGSRNGHE